MPPVTISWAVKRVKQSSTSAINDRRFASPNRTGQPSQPNDADHNTGGPCYTLKAEYATSIYNQPLVNTASVVWDIPYGRGQRFGGGVRPWVNRVLGGWEFSMFYTAHSGQPISLTYNPSAPFQVSGNLPSWLGGVTLRPNITGPVQLGNGEAQIDNFFVKSNIQIPTDRSQPFGNAGRNIGRAPHFNDFDIGVEKSIGLRREGTRLEFRAEFFNAFNHTNLQAPNADVSSAAFGTIRFTFDPRQVQFGLKLYF